MAALRTGSRSRYAMLAFFLLIFAVFAMLKPETFATTNNLRSILSQNAIVCLAALAVMLPLIAEEFDLAVAPMVGLSSVLAAGLTSEQGLPLWLAIVIILLVGVLVGVVHGVLIVRLGLPSLVVTLGTSSLLTGMILLYTNGGVIAVGLPVQLLQLGSATLAGIQLPVFVMIAVAAALWFLLEKRPWGRFLYATGASREAARLAGVPTDRLRTSAFILGALIAAIAGILLTGRNAAGHPSAFESLLLPSFAAAFLGAAAFRIGFYNAWGTVLAIYLLAVGVNGLKILGAPFWVDDVFNGIALIVAVGLSKLETVRIRRGREVATGRLAGDGGHTALPEQEPSKEGATPVKSGSRTDDPRGRVE